MQWNSLMNVLLMHPSDKKKISVVKVYGLILYFFPSDSAYSHMFSTSLFQITSTVKSLEFAVAQFSWYSWVALPNEFTFSTKTNLEELSFLLKLKTGASTKQHPQE